MMPMLNNRNKITGESYDQALLWVTLILLAFGMVMVYSASISWAEGKSLTHHQAAYYLIRHAGFLVVGLSIGAVAFQIPTRIWQKSAPLLFLIGLGMLILVLVPGIGHKVLGSRRWIKLVFFQIQPSEFMKFLAAVYVSDYTTRKAALMQSFKHGFLPMFFAMMFVGALLLAEPDFGAFVVIAAIAIAILWLGGINYRIFLGLLILLFIGFIILIWTSPYRLQRIVGYMDPWADPYGKGYQLTHALIAFGRGEWLGVGLGGSVEKLMYLPEAHTDFLLAVIAEELGFVGVATLVALFAWLVVRSFKIAKESVSNEQYFSALLAQGIGVWMGVQSIINMGVNMGLLPTKGLTLPLLSFGGTGVLANCVAMAVLLRIDWENKRLFKGIQV
ncbi:MAG: putative lipid II flippase FtsW [Candidatus Methylopumilus sp.]